MLAVVLVKFTMSSGPLSVVLPDALRERLVAEARKRGLPLSTAVRVLVAERVKELDEDEELTLADRWQREQAWSTWETLRAGAIEEASRREIDGDFEAALRTVRRRSRRA